MSEEKSPAPTTKPPPRRRAIPLVTSIIITLLVIACLTEGFLIYLKQLQVVASSGAADQVAGHIAKLEREKGDTENTLKRYYELVGPGDPAQLEELVRNARPPTVRGYLSEQEAKLTTTTTKLDELETGWKGMEKARDEAIQARGAADVQLIQKTTEFLQRLEALTKQLQAEQDARSKDVAALQAEVDELEGRLTDEEERSNDLGSKYNKEKQTRRALENWYQEHLSKVRVLLALSLRVPPESVGLSEAVVAADRLSVTLTDSGEEPVRFPRDPRFQEGMRFVIYDRQRRAKCLVQLVNVLPDKALGQVVEKYPQYSPVSPGDLAILDLAYEELRTRPGPPGSP